ncbi:ABC transporter ATP-binding protein [Deinococcus cellulosilyticus]|uniref:Multidrug ABC transporter ATP-binding protein n=1 Tax=Deinococcus cellulosilyticus (strain DSM 18568 / NBRC 106333 / KACC 11606 / 5516J-15) TaxID=1223518 RepID=A0A511N8G9_DEIC1|nr:ABC transporter ATP-binding protein [Deinococcus cellulosilyticus]GEM49120.1 multidrug ABC transporter ATP-binding protein [Deinococcus cellulosilyticus NBRC 106333 = KACC 11606]
MPVIETQNLTRAFKNHTVVNNLNLTVQDSQVFGYLGPNGAGKTTTIRMLCGVLPPSSGGATIAGVSLKNSEQIKARIGYANQAASVYTDLTVEENLSFKAGMYLKHAQVKNAVERTMELLKLEPYRKRLAGSLSGGWKQRLSIGTAIIHSPKIVFLDEPTAGLDPIARRELWDAIYDLTREGTTVFVTTHYMDEAERCHEVALIHSGNILAQGSPEQLKQNLRGHYYELEPRDLMAALQQSKTLGVDDAWITGSSLRVSSSRPIPEQDLQHLGARSRTVPPTLEDVFVTLARGVK